MINENKMINYLRFLGASMPYAAKSGHPGAPMGCSPIVYSLFTQHMKYAPKDPHWIARDRFVLSNGHGCSLLYAILYLCGYDITLEDLKNFRQLHSKTPGHPECFQTPGVEVTTGPLGQGIAQAVGLAIATEYCIARYNKDDISLFDNHIYCIVGDGCLQEGISSEASSLAGHLKLGRLIVFYDKNYVSIDGHTDLSFTEDVEARYKAYGWNVIRIPDADTNFDAITSAIQLAKDLSDKPTMVICHTTIGYGSVNEGSEKVHGAPLALNDMNSIKEKWGLEMKDFFDIPKDVLDFYRETGEANSECVKEWLSKFETYKAKYPNDGKEVEQLMKGELPKDWDKDLPTYNKTSTAASTRALSGEILNILANKIPFIIGGSADLTVSNACAIKCTKDFNSQNRSGRYIRFGVREHGMAAICNGLSSYAGFRPFGATFLNFYTYAWGAVRLSALSHLGNLYIATHDSIELGEDGPTHQPIEVSALCRATPNFNFIRPADGNEVVGAYRVWLLNKNTPTMMALCRNAVPHIEGTCSKQVENGAYIVTDFKNTSKPKVILGSCGTELHMCCEAAQTLESEFDVRIISVPCWNIFTNQSDEYKSKLFPNNVKSLYVEACNTLGSERYFTQSLGMNSFGASAPRDKVWKEFGFNAANIQARVKSLFS